MLPELQGSRTHPIADTVRLLAGRLFSLPGRLEGTHHSRDRSLGWHASSRKRAFCGQETRHSGQVRSCFKMAVNESSDRRIALCRPATLRSANAKTSSWIDAEAKRLLRRREHLLGALSSYCSVAKVLHKLGLQLYLNRHNTSESRAAAPTGGQANLQRLQDEIKALDEQLRLCRRSAVVALPALHQSSDLVNRAC